MTAGTCQTIPVCPALISEYLFCCQAFYGSYALERLYVEVLLIAQNQVSVRFARHGLLLKVHHVFHRYSRQRVDAEIIACFNINNYELL